MTTTYLHPFDLVSETSPTWPASQLHSTRSTSLPRTPSPPEEEEEEEHAFPPSISQRSPNRTQKSRVRIPAGPPAVDVDGRSLVPVEGRRVKVKKSFDRTRLWAQEVERQRSDVLLTPEEMEGENRISFDDSDSFVRAESISARSGSTQEESRKVRRKITPKIIDLRGVRSPRPVAANDIPALGLPITASPLSPEGVWHENENAQAGPSRITPRGSYLTVPDSELEPLPILSIDDIVKRHSVGVASAIAAVKEKARKELGIPAPQVVLKPELETPEPPDRTTATPRTPRTPLTPNRAFTTDKGDSSPSAEKMLKRMSRSPAKTIMVPPRTTSIDLARVQSRSSGAGSLTEGIRIGQTLLQQLGSAKSLSSSSPSTPRSRFSVRIAIPEESTILTEEEETHRIAVYLRSPHMNRIIQIPRPYPLTPLNVSFAEVGWPSGKPVLVFLGLGAVRHLIALYHDLAVAYRLRLICVDRWGFGKTEMGEEMDRGVMEWTSVVGRVLEHLEISADAKFQLLAHSAGAPYAMAVAKLWPERIRGKIHLLAPWVSADIDGGYKWLKWVPNGVIKTATAVDWRMTTYQLGKAPVLQHKPVGYTAPSPASSQTSIRPDSLLTLEDITPSKQPSLARRASNLLRPSSRQSGSSFATPDKDRGFGRSPRMKNIKFADALRRTSVHTVTSAPPSFDSMGTSHTATSSILKTPPLSQRELDFGLSGGFDTFSADLGLCLPSDSPLRDKRLPISPTKSFHTAAAAASPKRSAVQDKTFPPPPITPAFTLALQQSSHAESEPGTTSELLSIILQRDSKPKPWGFSYEEIKTPLKVWWGSEDDKVSKKGIEWLETVCQAKICVVNGEGHNLMTNAGVMCEVFESLGKEARRV